MTGDSRVTVLGSCGGFPEPGRACSGFLVTHAGSTVLLDLGYGAFQRLLAERPAGNVDAVVVTHEHPDHCIDLHALFRMHLYAGGSARRIPLYCPPGVVDRLAGIEPDVDLRAVFDVSPLPGSYDVGPFHLTSTLLPHWVDDVGVRLENDEVAIAYTGDTGPVPELAELGRDTDLFIVEATDHPDQPQASVRNLMSANEAGYWGAAAGAERLLLTHFWPGNDRQQAVEDAREHFTGEIIAAAEGLVVSF